MSIHPGAALFSESARKAVAEGPLFDFFGATTGDWGYMRHSDLRCIVGALAKADGHTRIKRTPSRRSVRTLARSLTGRKNTPMVEALADLLDRNDAGRYRDRANLYADLLGESPTPALGGGAANGESPS